MLSHSGERIEINVIDSSDIRAANRSSKTSRKVEKEFLGEK
jgi:hypothetical protein